MITYKKYFTSLFLKVDGITMEDLAVAPCLSINTVETSGWWQGSSMSPEQSTPSLLWTGIHWHSCGNIVLRTVTQDFYIFESCDSYVSFLFSYVEYAWSKNFIFQTRRVTHTIFQTRSASLFRFERLHSSLLSQLFASSESLYLTFPSV